MPIQSQIPASSTSGGGQNRCGTVLSKQVLRQSKQLLRQGLSQQLLETGVETSQQLLSLGVHRVTRFTSISRVASCSLRPLGCHGVPFSVWQVTDKPLFNGSFVASTYRRRRCGGRMSGASLARRRVEQQRR